MRALMQTPKNSIIICIDRYILLYICIYNKRKTVPHRLVRSMHDSGFDAWHSVARNDYCHTRHGTMHPSIHLKFTRSNIISCIHYTHTHICVVYMYCIDSSFFASSILFSTFVVVVVVAAAATSFFLFF